MLSSRPLSAVKSSPALWFNLRSCRPPATYPPASGRILLGSIGLHLADRVYETLLIRLHTRGTRMKGLDLTSGREPANAFGVVVLGCNIGIGLFELRGPRPLRIVGHLLCDHAFPLVPRVRISAKLGFASIRRRQLDLALLDKSVRLSYVVRRVLGFRSQ